MTTSLRSMRLLPLGVGVAAAFLCLVATTPLASAQTLSWKTGVATATGDTLPGPIELKDIDGDTDMDLVIANKGSGGAAGPGGSIAMLLNDGSGTFTPMASSPFTLSFTEPTIFGAPENLHCFNFFDLQEIDVNNDGFADWAVTGTIASTTYSGGGTFSSRSPAFLRSLGSFSSYDVIVGAPLAYTVTTSGDDPVQAFGISVDNYDNTSSYGTTGNSPNVDLLSVDPGELGAPQRLKTLGYLNNWNHVLGASATYDQPAGDATSPGLAALGVPWTARYVVGGEWDGNPTPGVITLDQFTTPGTNTAAECTILFFEKDGGPTPYTGAIGNNALTLPAGHTGAFNLAKGDFDKDGAEDVAVVTNNGIAIYYSNIAAPGTFTSLGVLTATAPLGTGIAVADFDGDGNQDIAVLTNGGLDFEVLLGDGQGPGAAVWTLETAVAIGGTGEQVRAADFDGDGKPDLAVTIPSTGEVMVILQSVPAGTLTISGGGGGGTPAPGATDVELATLRFLAAGEDITVTNLVLTLTTTLGGLPAHVTNVRLYHDQNKSGTLEIGTDPQVFGPSSTWTGTGPWTMAAALSPTVLVPAGTAEEIFVVADIAVAAPDGATFTISIAANGDVTITSGSGSATVTGAPAAGGTTTVSAPTTVTIVSPADGSTFTYYVGDTVSELFDASFGATPYTWSRNVPIPWPGGLTFATTGADPDYTMSGLLSAVDANFSPYAISVTVNDAGTGSDTNNYTLEVFALPTFTVDTGITGAGTVGSPALLPDGTEGADYQGTPTAPVTIAAIADGKAPITWSLAGTFPAGLTVAGTGVGSRTGEVSGSTLGTAGTYNFQIVATDAGGKTATIETRMVVNAPPALVATLPAAQETQLYSNGTSAGGGTAPSTYAITAGALPSGLGLNGTTGLISGTPALGQSVSSPFAFTVTVTDINGGTASQAYSLVVNQQPVGVSGGNTSSGGGGFCFVVTASGAAPQGPLGLIDTTGSHRLSSAGAGDVALLREFRHVALMDTAAGRAAVAAYQRTGPYAAAAIADRPSAQGFAHLLVVLPARTLALVTSGQWSRLSLRDGLGLLLLLGYALLLFVGCRRLRRPAIART